MTTSGTTVFAMSALDMVTNAMIELGLLSSGGVPTGAETEDGLIRLNSMLKSWQSQGVNLWREDERSVTITANTTPTALSADVRQVFSACFIGTSYERLLGKWERADYLALPIKDTEGDPSIFYVSRQRDALNLYLWPVPTSTSTVKIDCERIVETVTDASEDVDIPQHAYEAVWINLAARLIPMFNSSGATIAPSVAAFIVGRAQQLFQVLMDDDRPESIFIGPY
ncbi:MAG: hypothetical protein JWR80_9488 [Bradyrhizobium sp.]|nr:hypothetical protein [Bradyrhizobium sp.]